MSGEAIVSGRFHVATAVRRSWVLLSGLGWLAWDHHDEVLEGGQRWGVGVVVGAGVLLAGLVVGVVVAAWRAASFTLTATHLDYRYGLLRKVHEQVPLDRVMTVDVQAPLFGRPLGLRALTIGTVSAPVRLAYLGPGAAGVLHDALVDRSGAGSGVRRDPDRVARVTAGVLGLSIVLDARVMVRLVVGGVTSFVPFMASGHAVSLALALPWLRSAWHATGKRFPRDHGWTLTEVPGGYRTEYGLFNKQRVTFQADRVTSVTIHQPVLWRSRDWVRVQAGVIGRGQVVLVPVTTRAQAEKILVRVFGLEILELLDHGRPLSARGRRCTWWWRGCAWTHNARFAAGWQGLFLRQTVTVAPVARVSAVSVEQGWWQRACGVATVWVKLPGGGSVEAVHRDVGEAAGIAGELRGRARAAALAGVPIARPGRAGRAVVERAG